MRVTSLKPNHVALLLDFDGVIMRNPRVNRYVATTCTRFLARRADLSFHQAAKINQEKYPIYGHTSQILVRDFKIPCSITSFNEGVYAELIDYGLIKRMITPEDRAYVRTLYDMLFYMHTPVFSQDRTLIFTNAMDTWCKEILPMLGMPSNAFGHILASNTHTDVKLLKPEVTAYTEADRQTQQVIPHMQRVVFIDDQLHNVNPTILPVHWKGIHYPHHMTLFELSKQLTLATQDVESVLISDKESCE